MTKTPLFAAAALAAIVPASAQTAPPVAVLRAKPASSAAIEPLPVAQRAAHDRGLVFARLYIPAEQAKQAGLEQARAQFLKTFETVPENVELEKRYPGSRDAALKATLDLLGPIYDESLPGVQVKVADLVTQYLSGPQLEKVIAFAGSPTGRRIQQVVGESMSYDKMTERATSDPDNFNLSNQDVIRAVDPGFIAKLTPAEIRDFAAFNSTTAGARFNRFAPILLQLVAEQTSMMVRDHIADVQTAVMQAVAQHIATLNAGSK